MSGQTQRGQLEKDDSGFSVGWNYNYITATGATLVKSGGAMLHNIAVNKPVSGCVITLNDATAAGSGTFAQITFGSSTIPTFVNYDVTLTNGLVVNVTNAAANITVSYV